MSKIEIHGESGQPDWKKRIEESDAFFVILTKYYIQDLERMQELAYAIQISKKLIVAVLDDINPEPYLRGGKILVKRTFHRKDVRTPLGQELINDFLTEALEKLG